MRKAVDKNRLNPPECWALCKGVKSWHSSGNVGESTNMRKKVLGSDEAKIEHILFFAFGTKCYVSQKHSTGVLKSFQQ